MATFNVGDKVRYASDKPFEDNDGFRVQKGDVGEVTVASDALIGTGFAARVKFAGDDVAGPLKNLMVALSGNDPRLTAPGSLWYDNEIEKAEEN